MFVVVEGREFVCTSRLSIAVAIVLYCKKTNKKTKNLILQLFALGFCFFKWYYFNKNNI